MAGEDVNRPPEGFTQEPKEPISILSKGVGVPTDLLGRALDLEVGSTIGRMSIASRELAQQLAELTEDPRFKDMPILPMFVKRSTENSWEIQVGKRTYEADRGTIEKIIKGENDEENLQHNPPSLN